MAPITMVFLLTGLAVFLQAMFFLGIGASETPGSKSPLVSVGYVALIAGIADLAVALYITVGRPLGPDPSLLLAGLISIYGLFFVTLGLTEILGLDLRVIGNLAVPTALVPLAWLPFFSGSTTFTAILIFWVVTFLAITMTTYGRLSGKALGLILLITSLFTFLIVPVSWAMGITLP
jgi:hypothetical protein